MPLGDKTFRAQKKKTKLTFSTQKLVICRAQQGLFTKAAFVPTNAQLRLVLINQSGAQQKTFGNHCIIVCQHSKNLFVVCSFKSVKVFS